MNKNTIMLAMRLHRRIRDGALGSSENTLRHLSRMRRLARQLKKLAVKGCNQGTTLSDEMLRDKIRADIDLLCEYFDVRATYGDDPRGPIVEVLGLRVGS